MAHKLNNNHAAIIDFLNERHPGETVSVRPESPQAIEAAKLFLTYDSAYGKYTGTIEQMACYFEAIEAVNVSAWNSGKI